MKISSLGYRTDLIFPKFDGQIIDRGSYLVILTPSNPTYYWGNFLLFPNPPGQNNFNTWKKIFAKEIGSPPHVQHMAFAWDSIDGQTGEVKPFLDDGFNLNQLVVLTTQQVLPPPKYNREVIIRPIATDGEWEQALENQIVCHGPEYNEPGYRVFKTAQMARYRQMIQAGLGQWFGAFLENQLVADLGIFLEKELGRFQQVETHPDFRRRGICGALVYQVSSYAFAQMGAKTLVMIADENYHAARIYETVGFKPTERSANLDWWDKSNG